MSKQCLSSELASLLEEALNFNLENYDITIDGNNAAGDGYMGEMVCI